MNETPKQVYEDLEEVYKSECRRIGERSGLPFMITQFEYEGTWQLK